MYIFVLKICNKILDDFRLIETFFMAQIILCIESPY